MNGSCATFSNCWRAASSSGTPLVHALMGTPLSGLITLYVVSVIVSSLRSTELRSGVYRVPALPVEPSAELARRFERRSRSYEARALPTELHQHKTLEVAGRIALPMICFAGRCLAVLATPPHNFGAEGGTRTRALDAGNVGSWPLDDFRLGASSES